MTIGRMKNVFKRWKGQFLYFSPWIAIADFLVSTVFRKSDGKIKHNLNVYYYNKAKSIICKRYSDVIEKWKYEGLCLGKVEKISRKSKIFVFWWQGYSDMPYIVKECIKTITKHSNQHEVVIIDKDSWADYAEIPDYILRLRDQGVINFTLFSDILRCCLLYENGGIWIDPTCYVTEDFHPDIYEHAFYTIKHGDEWSHPICKGYWATFFLACGEKNPIIGFMRELFFEYWKHEKSFVVYLSLDLFLAIAYENFEYAKKMIDDIPYNNRGRDQLREMLIKSKGKNFNTLLKQVDNNTYINKLTYKMNIEQV